MEVLKTILEEALTIIFALVLFIICVGIKVECRVCRARFYFHHEICPECGYRYNEPLPEDDATNLGDQSNNPIIKD